MTPDPATRAREIVETCEHTIRWIPIAVREGVAEQHGEARRGACADCIAAALAEQDAALAEARRALEKYGVHLPQCEADQCGVVQGQTWLPCTCGLAEARRATQESTFRALASRELADRERIATKVWRVRPNDDGDGRRDVRGTGEATTAGSDLRIGGDA